LFKEILDSAPIQELFFVPDVRDQTSKLQTSVRATRSQRREARVKLVHSRTRLAFLRKIMAATSFVEEAASLNFCIFRITRVSACALRCTPVYCMYTPVYPCVPLCTPAYPCVPLCTPVYPCVPLCTVPRCTPVYPCVLYCTCTSVYPYVPLCTPMYSYVPLCTIPLCIPVYPDRPNLQACDWIYALYDHRAGLRRAATSGASGRLRISFHSR
jgi:hypothetical protein